MEDSSFGAYLLEQYKSSCEVCDTFPDLNISQQFGKGVLNLKLDKLDIKLIEPICHSLSQKVTPLTLKISNYKYTSLVKEEAKIFKQILGSVAIALRISKTLTQLQFMNLTFPASSLHTLCIALHEINYLQHLAFHSCNINGSRGVEKICQAIKNSPSLSCLVFNNCSVDCSGANSLRQLLLHQNMNRSSILWQDTLRDKRPYFDSMRGLRYLSLSNNPLFGDNGFQQLATGLQDDIWILEIKLENCGLTSEIGKNICDLLKINQSLKIFAIGNNPFLNEEITSEVDAIMRMRNPQLTRPTLGISNVVSQSARASIAIPTKAWQQKVGIPYRVERRIIERREEMPPGALSSLLKDLDRVKPKAKNQKSKAKEDKNFTIFNLRNIRKLIRYYKEKVKREKHLRRKAEMKWFSLQKKLKKLEERLESNYLLNETTICHIEKCLDNFSFLIGWIRAFGAANGEPVASKALNELILPLEMIRTQEDISVKSKRNDAKKSSRNNVDNKRGMKKGSIILRSRTKDKSQESANFKLNETMPQLAVTVNEIMREEKSKVSVSRKSSEEHFVLSDDDSSDADQHSRKLSFKLQCLAPNECFNGDKQIDNLVQNIDSLSHNTVEEGLQSNLQSSNLGTQVDDFVEAGLKNINENLFGGKTENFLYSETTDIK